MTLQRPAIVVAVDPGRTKCGVAAMTVPGETVSLAIVDRAELVDAVRAAAGAGELHAVLVGDRTGSRPAIEDLQGADLPAPVIAAPEHGTTLRARARYFQDHPPRGWQRLIPRGMLIPPRPVDDYAALVIAEDWLAGQ